MAKKCWGCNRHNVSIFAWLAGDNVCMECKKNLPDQRISENYKTNSQQSIQEKETQNESSRATADKVYTHGKNAVSLVFGIVAFLWFIVMLPAQSDFEGIVLGWAIIGGIYLLYKLLNR